MEDDMPQAIRYYVGKTLRGSPYLFPLEHREKIDSPYQTKNTKKILCKLSREVRATSS